MAIERGTRGARDSAAITPKLEELQKLSKQQSSDSKQREPKQQIDLPNRIIPKNLVRIKALSIAISSGWLGLIKAARQEVEEEREWGVAWPHLESDDVVRIGMKDLGKYWRFRAEKNEEFGGNLTFLDDEGRKPFLVLGEEICRE